MNNHYKDLLSLWIKKRGLTLRQITQRCQEKGLTIDPSYISKLQTGRLPPPTENVSRILAEVLEANPNEFAYYGYLAKAPEIIRTHLQSDTHELSEALLYANRILNLSPKLRQKLINEIQWLETLNNASQ